MVQFPNIEALERALHDLGDVLERDGNAFELYVIGGAAFLLQEPFRAQSTGDLDVAAQVHADGSTTSPVPLPAPLAEAAAVVANLHGFSAGWINSAAAASFDNLLPAGALERARVQRWGGLTLHVADRIDLIKLKFQAAQRRGDKGARYRRDLALVRPTDAELDAALEWYLGEQLDAGLVAERAREIVEQIREQRDA